MMPAPYENCGDDSSSGPPENSDSVVSGDESTAGVSGTSMRLG